MKFKSYYLDLLLLSSIFYFVMGLIDFTITMCGYTYYGYSFFQIELNEIICFLLKMGIPPMHMYILPFIVICLSLYMIKETKKLDKKELDKIDDRTVWLVLSAISVVTMMGILHLGGFLSWFYYGAF